VLGSGKLTSLKLREQVRNGIGAKFVERTVELFSGAALVASVFVVERSGEPLIEREAIDHGAGVPARDEDPASGESKQGEEKGDPEPLSGFSFGGVDGGFYARVLVSVVAASILKFRCRFDAPGSVGEMSGRPISIIKNLGFRCWAARR